MCNSIIYIYPFYPYGENISPTGPSFQNISSVNQVVQKPRTHDIGQLLGLEAMSSDGKETGTEVHLRFLRIVGMI